MDYDLDLPFIAPYSFRVYLQNNDLDHLEDERRLFLTDWNDFGKGSVPKELKCNKKGIKGNRLTISSEITKKVKHFRRLKAENYRLFYKSFKDFFSMIKKPTEKLFSVRYSKDIGNEKKIDKKIWMFNFLENCSKSWLVMDKLFEKMIDLDFRIPRVLDSRSKMIISKWMAENGEKEMVEKDVCKKLLSGLLLLTQIDKRNMVSHALLDNKSDETSQLSKEQLEMLKGEFMKPLPKKKHKLGVSSMFHAFDNYSIGIEIRQPQEKKDKFDEEAIRRGLKRKLDGFMKYKTKTFETNRSAKLCLTMKDLMLPSMCPSPSIQESNERNINVSSKNIFEEGGGYVYDARMHNAKQVVLYLSFDDLIPVQGVDSKLKDDICVIDGDRSLQIAILLRLDQAFVNGVQNGPKIEDFVVFNTRLNEKKRPIFPFEKKVAMFPSANNSAFHKDCIEVTCDPSIQLCSRECSHDGNSKQHSRRSSSSCLKNNDTAALSWKNAAYMEKLSEDEYGCERMDVD